MRSFRLWETVLLQSSSSALRWSVIAGWTGFSGLGCTGFLVCAVMDPALEESTVSALEGDDLPKGVG